MKKKQVAVVIISNGPGEMATWVKPVINNVNKIIKNTPRENYLKIILTLVPCPNATGNEFKVASSWKKIDLVTPAYKFWKLLIKPSLFTKWPKEGIVIFLGGDQFWSVLLARRLGYQSITYAEWTARWPQWNSKILAMNETVKNKLSKKHKKKCLVIGDLMADIEINTNELIKSPHKKWIAILPGSKKTKLLIGIPYFLEVADLIKNIDSSINLMIPLANTTSIQDYLDYQSDKNPISKYYSSKIKVIKKIKDPVFDYILETEKNSKIYIITKVPNYDILAQCDLALTTVGANTAELAAIKLPMIVILPTQHLDIMHSWDGIFGLLGHIPIFNRLITLVLKKWYLNKNKFFSWPNIKANKLIIPERIGEIFPKEIAIEALSIVNNKDLLEEMRRKLSIQRGEKGASKKLANIIVDLVDNLNTTRDHQFPQD